MSEGGKQAVQADDEVVAASEVRRLQDRVRELERLLGRRTMEVEILKEALELARAKNRPGCRTRRFREIRGESGQRDARRGALECHRAPQRCATPARAAGAPRDIELAGLIRRFVDERPTYGYRRIAALLKRERRSDGLPPVNAKRVYRLMNKHGLLLERHTGRRRAREHDGQVATICSNCRWCPDAFEFTRWNGEVVRVAVALDCHDVRRSPGRRQPPASPAR